jgi:hypothetical protein
LLHSYLTEGAYVDCYVTDLTGPVSQAQYVAAFYTTLLFKLERLILDWVVSKPSTDAEARQLAAGSTEVFAAWHVEQRSENQLLLSDFRGATRSWLMAVPRAGNQGTRLYFGSAVVPSRHARTGTPRLGLGFRLLLGFHKLYSVLLLYSAKSRLETQRV